MALGYTRAELHGGALDGQVVQVSPTAGRSAELVVGVPVPVLDDATEPFW